MLEQFAHVLHEPPASISQLRTFTRCPKWRHLAVRIFPMQAMQRSPCLLRNKKQVNDTVRRHEYRDGVALVLRPGLREIDLRPLLHQVVSMERL